MATTYSIQQRKKAQGIMTWYLRTCTDGKQKFESLHTTKKGEAMAILERIRLKAAMPTLPGQNDMEIRTMAERWMQQTELSFGKGSRTSLAYASRIRRWTRWCEASRIRQHSDFGGAAAYGFVRDISAEVAPKTVREVVKVVKKCIEWNTDTFDLKRMDSFRSIKTPKVRSGRVEFWTSGEVERILENAPSDAFRAFWGLMAFAGLRFSEARFLKRSSVRSGLISVVNGKGGKDAELPVSKRLEALLRPFMAQDGDLLIPKAEVPVRSDKAVKYLKMAVCAAGIESGEISHHKLRHSFASELLRRGVNPRTVQELMRHSSIDTLFDHYAHVLRSDLKDAVNLI